MKAIKSKEVLSQLNPYQQGMQINDVKKKYNLDRIVKLASNENPFGYSQEVKKYMSDFHFELEVYPDGHASELRTALANKLSIGEDKFVFGNGSDELVQIIARTFLSSNTNTIMATPTFPQYKHHALIEGAKIQEVPVTKEGYHDLETMLDLIDYETRVMWICSPNNPTGCTESRSDFSSFMKKCPKDILVVLDEAYYEFVRESKDIEAIKLLENHSNLLILRTFSKAYGLAGIRIGYGIGDEKIIEQLNIVRGPFNTSSVAQKLASIALNDEEFLRDITQKNREIKIEFEKKLSEIGWSYYDSETNFLFIETPIPDEEVFQILLENGFIVRPGNKLGIPNRIRVTIGEHKDMQELIMILKTI